MVGNENIVDISERKYQSLFKNSIACIAFHKITYDSNGVPVNYVITDVNPMYEKILGLKKEDVVGRLATDVYPSEEPPYFPIFLKVAETLKPTSFTTKFDELNRYVRLSVFSFEKGTFVTVFEDFSNHMDAIQKLKEKEDELKVLNLDLEQELNVRIKKLLESEIQFQNIVQSSPMGIHMYKLEPDDKLVFIGANLSADKILGVDNSQFIGKTIEEAFPPLKETEVPFQYRKVAKEGITWSTKHINYEDQHIKGAYEVYAFQTSPGKMAAFFLDTTEKLRAEKKLSESEEKYRTLFEQAGDAILIIDPESGNIIDFNNKTYEILGFTREEFKNMKLVDFNIIKDEKVIIDRLQKTLREGSSLFENQHITKTGEIKNILINAKVIKFQNKNVIQGMWRDITDLKRAEEKYHQAYNLAEFYKDLFAHDMSNIMQNILTSIELSSIYLNNNEEQEKILNLFELIKTQVKRGADLVSNVRKLSTIEDISTNLEDIDVKAFLINSIKKVKKSFPNLLINFRVGSTMEKISVKTTSLLQDVFDNLINNAVKHNENKEIEISIKISEIQKQNNNYLKLEFIDNGRGVISSQKREIFERQTSANQKSKGIGLGLSLVKQIIESIRGEIWVEDKVEGDHTMGSNFVILIPIKNY